MQLQPELLSSLKLPAIRQQGIIVKSIDQSVPYYRQVLNIHPWYRIHFEEEEIYYEGRRIDLELKIAVGYSGPLQFELIEVVGGEDNIYTELINHQTQGLHHIGFEVSNFQKKTELLRNAGFTPIQHGILKTKGNTVIRFAYFDTMACFGYILELIETTLFGVHVGMSPFMCKLGALIGELEVIS
jgi:catechol 2,3-dioxygenase-like lactoylglutathione lyase family enzyme